jgi:hypothetical protein
MRLIYIALWCLLLSSGCNNATNTNDGGSVSRADSTPAKPVAEPVRSKLNDEGTQILMSAVGSYYELKNALVAASAPKADVAAGVLATKAESLKAFLQKDTTNANSLKPYVDSIITQSKQVTSVMDETCERKRLAFSPLSSALYGLLKTVELKHAAIYHEYCPMAFNEKGAYWLSEEADIKNPYFGKKMLECGEVTDSLK